MKISLCLDMALLSLSLEERILKAGELGLKFVEICLVVNGKFPGSPEALAKVTDKAGVKILDTVMNAPDGSTGGNLADPHQNTAKFSISPRRRLPTRRRRESRPPSSSPATASRGWTSAPWSSR